jgi:tryptophan synthase alpha chain
MNRIESRWKSLRAEGRKALITFVTAGDPDLQTTKELVSTLEKGGADIIELGVPFSDPMADGPVIQKASERALVQGTTLEKVIQLVREIRQQTQIPLLLMGYYNPIFAYGLKKFAKEAARAGVDAVLVVDLPLEESEELDEELKKVGMDLIYLLTPTSDTRRIRLALERARGFLYFVSMTGITGTKLRSEAEVKKKVKEVKHLTSLPVAVGFGISTPEQAREVSQIADGVVVGSALVNLAYQSSLEGPSYLPKLESFVRSLKASFGTP